ncbi:MAG: phosphatase PAP2 family protein [Bacteroidales bacterium]|nr:phosphatase PAP2 family protein [Bacteroidales bacterium]
MDAVKILYYMHRTIRLSFILLAIISINLKCYSSEIDSLPLSNIDESCISNENIYKFKPSQIILPAALIGIGITGLESGWVKQKNRVIRNGVRFDNRTNIDNFLPYAPIAGYYAINLFKVKGEHNIVEGTAIFATAYVIMACAANGTKLVINSQRPDKSNFHSFPSGHTATAFMAAEFIRKEYNNVSPWIGISAYTIATATGVLRVCNDHHWTTDVIAGAGIGILSTKAAYWLYPFLKKHIFNTGKLKNMMAMPYYNQQSLGLSLQVAL